MGRPSGTRVLGRGPGCLHGEGNSQESRTPDTIQYAVDGSVGRVPVARNEDGVLVPAEARPAAASISSRR